MTKSVIFEQLENGSYSPSVTQEFMACIDALEDTPFKMPKDIDGKSFVEGIAYAFLPHQIAAVDQIRDMSPSTKEYFKHEVQPNLMGGAEQGIPQVMRVARHIGRVLTAMNKSGLSEVEYDADAPLKIGSDFIRADGYDVPFHVETGRVIEWGMGISGLDTHISNLRAGRYYLYGVHHTAGETEVLRGAMDYHGIPPEISKLGHAGLIDEVDMLIADSDWNEADLIIASRVHMAGDDLLYGVESSGQLLRDGGLLVARGPRKSLSHSAETVGYDEVATIIDGDENMKFQVNYAFAHIASNGDIEPNRLIVAEKRPVVVPVAEETPKRRKLFGIF